jgi:hypothetical protein
METYKVLPKRYQVLPVVVPFKIPDFLRCYHEGNVTFSPVQTETEAWFKDFSKNVTEAVGKAYLPVCRMSDGEFRTLLGDRTLDSLHPFPVRIRHWLGYFKRKLFAKRVTFATRSNCSSGDYSRQEVKLLAKRYGECLAELASKGVLAIHLSYGNWPFQEHFFPSFKRWLRRQSFELTLKNYIPFYFVYALVRGPARRELLRNRRVLLVTGANVEKRVRIEKSLREEGAAEIFWCPISSSRSFYDKIDVSPWVGKVDVAFVGAGVGKPAILLQLEPLQVPALDVGFIFEVWADPEVRWERAVCVTDAEYDPRRVKYLPADLQAQEIAEWDAKLDGCGHNNNKERVATN